MSEASHFPFTKHLFPEKKNSEQQPGVLFFFSIDTKKFFAYNKFMLSLILKSFKLS